jgi:hypothetical protein
MSAMQWLDAGVTTVQLTCVIGGAVTVGTAWAVCGIVTTRLTVLNRQHASRPETDGDGRGQRASAAVGHACTIANAARKKNVVSTTLCGTSAAIGALLTLLGWTDADTESSEKTASSKPKTKKPKSKQNAYIEGKRRGQSNDSV